MSWLKKHNPQISWEKHTLIFNSNHCSNNCLSTPTILELKAVEEIPLPYQEFSKVFSEEESSKLPPHRPYDIAIELLPDAKPRHGPIYSLGPKEDAELRETIEKQLKAGLIRPSKSPMASPILFVKKRTGNYAFRIKEGDEWKTAFKTKYGLFEYLVMPFGLTNAPAAFQDMMNEIFRDLLDVYVIIYLDDILVFSLNEKDHEVHVREVLKRLQDNDLFCNIEKCHFHVKKIDYLGFIISEFGIEVDQSKVTDALNWSTPKNVKNIQEFLGFNLEYFSTSQSLNKRQIRWANFLVDYNFQIIYRPGAQNKKADILSRRYDLVPLEGGVENQVLLKPELFIASITPDQEINDLIGEAIYEDDRLKEILLKLQNKEKVTDWELKEGLLCFQGKIFVPKDNTIRNLILESRHDALAAGHPGQARTLELVSRNYYWPSLKKFVNSYVSHCETCIRSKPTNQLPVGLLKPLQIPERPWEDIAYDMIVGLPGLEGFDAILTVIDRFSKMVHFIPTQSTASAINIANLFITYVWKLHGLPRSTVSDRGPTFNAKFIRHLYKRLDIKPTYSTAYHPQTDGQTERIQREAEIFIRMFGNHRQSDWVSLLPLAEFALNNLKQTSTGKSPFQICYGFNPRFSVGQKSDKSVPNADEHAEFLEKGYDEVKATLSLLQERMKYFYDQNHRKEEEIQVGDKVWLSHQNISTDRPSIKLSHKKLGPYLVIEKIGLHAYKLQLPHTMRIHPVFHINLLTKFHPDPHGRNPPQPAPVITEEGEEEYEVEKILDSKWKGRGKSKKLWYLVKWKGYDEGSNSWEPVDNVTNAKEVREDFHKEYPDAVGA
ncbi:hypothetical protein RHS01_01831 [Rhizoctonia solani]|uniref:Retrotransposable element Tf2 155 kDa protein type 1 n=1 Tax=Rhizoctonia solani TaxID=456999 RepID=A0A8H7IKF8_9AGAM|nr:hypothetical protein RHS01_01831 [Rhizoctonia solani]